MELHNNTSEHTFPSNPDDAIARYNSKSYQEKQYNINSEQTRARTKKQERFNKFNTHVEELDPINNLLTNFVFQLEYDESVQNSVLNYMEIFGTQTVPIVESECNIGLVAYHVNYEFNIGDGDKCLFQMRNQNPQTIRTIDTGKLQGYQILCTRPVSVSSHMRIYAPFVNFCIVLNKQQQQSIISDMFSGISNTVSELFSQNQNGDEKKTDLV